MQKVGMGRSKSSYTAVSVTAEKGGGSLEDYLRFLESKVAVSDERGFKINPNEVHPICKPHQVDSIVWAVRGGCRAIFAAFGLGKSIMQLEVLRLILKHAGGGRGLIVAPLGVRQEFMRDAREKLGFEVTFVRSIEDVRQRELFEERSNIYITNYETVRDGKLDPAHFTVTTLDEAACFVPGTLIETPEGEIPIERIKVGDRIFNASGVDYVRAVHRKEIKTAVRLKIGSRTIISSDNHRFFTRRGWLRADEIQQGDAVMETASAVRLLQSRHRSQDVARSEEEVLRSILLSEMANFTAKHNGSNESHQSSQSRQPYQPQCGVETAQGLRVVSEDLLSQIRLRTETALLRQSVFGKMANESAISPSHHGTKLSYVRGQKKAGAENQRVVESRLSKSSSAKTTIGQYGEECQRSQQTEDGGVATRQNIFSAWREWTTNDSAVAIGRSAGRFTDRISNRNGDSQEPVPVSTELLQGRHCHSSQEDCYRSGWQFPQDEEMEISRQEENGGSQFARVDGVEILESRHSDLDKFRDADGKLYFYDLSATRHPSYSVTGLLVHNCLRGFGGTKTFREFMRLFDSVQYKFVATATPDPNEYIEMLAYSAYLGVMDVSAAKTRFFKRDSVKADKLTLHPHKEEEFWCWVASWGLFLQKPSDLGHSDEGYALPELEVVYHEIPANADTNTTAEKNGQVRMFKDSRLGVMDAAKEKRDTLQARVDKAREILAANPEDHFILWHDLEAEREAIEKAVPSSFSVYGSQPLDERETIIADFSDGKIQYLAGKPVMLGSGCNFQRHCSQAIYVGIGFKFNDFIQSVHRLHRFLQTKTVRIHLIYAESERGILENLMKKWERYKVRAKKMSGIIQRFGLSQQAMIAAMARAMGVERVEVSGKDYKIINNDCVIEAKGMADNSVGLILTSIPFSTQYEYSPNFADFGHSESNAEFFKQMDYLAPELFRVLQPGRVCAIHVKDRIVPGGMTGLGFQTTYPFHVDCILHYTKHGFGYLGMKTIVTDVVRENNQTYRLGWTEQCKDGTKMGVGMPEYLLLFRKPPTDTTNSYADVPVVKQKKSWNKTLEVWENPKGYSRSRWQIDAHGFERSNGNRPPTPEEIENLPHHMIFKMFKKWSLENVYDFEYHVRLGEALEQKQRLPVTFMLLQPQSWSPDVWTDITRMRTLNSSQAVKGKQQHLCLAVGSLVLTREGFKPIETVNVGDEVLTHKGRWRQVIVSRSTGVRPVVTVKAQGVPGLTLTPDHKLWTRKTDWVRERDGAERAEPDWAEAKDTQGAYVNLKLPPTEQSSLSELEWWIVGRWIADGHQETRGSFMVSVGPEKLNAFLDKVGDHAGGQNRLAAIQVRLKGLSEPLKATLSQCGRGATKKRLPSEAFTLSPKYAQALLAGYLSGDGHYLQDRKRWTASSVSKELLLGLSMLVQRAFESIASVYPGRAPGQAVIEGRTVNTNQDWMFSFDVPSKDRRKSNPFILEDGAWKKVRSVEETGEIETWNLRVEEDESYTAEGCVVKNCPMQFDIANRVIAQMSNPGDVVFDPFAGLGTVPMEAVKQGRFGIGTELSPAYFADACYYIESASKKVGAPTLFDLVNAEADAEEDGFPMEEEVVYVEESALRKAA